MKIRGESFAVKDIFSSNFEFFIPEFQRPYAWGIEEAGALYDDLYDFYKEISANSDDLDMEAGDDYFLGSIVLQKREDNPRSEVIDGQQRLTTLTILISVIASRLTKHQEECVTFLIEKGSAIMNIASKPRLHLRELDQNFFEEYIQRIDLERLFENVRKRGEDFFKDEAQINIYQNASLFNDRLAQCFPNEKKLEDFLSFLLQKCYLVLICTPSEGSAFRAFSVLNKRGLDLTEPDYFKSIILGKIPREDREIYAEKWESMENKNGRNGFKQVCSCAKDIITKKLDQSSKFIDVFQEKVIAPYEGEEIVDRFLEPFSDAYFIIQKQCYTYPGVDSKLAGLINEYLFWLNKINHVDLLAPLIKFISVYKDDPETLLWFLKKFERLSAYLYVMDKDKNQWKSRCGAVLMEIPDSPLDLVEKGLAPLELKEEEKQAFLGKLGGDIYNMPSVRRRYVLMRLNAFLADESYVTNEVVYSSITTIEHVLPENYPLRSKWAQTWSEKEKKQYLNKAANLVFLTKRKNSKARNLSFDDKKRIYFRGKDGTSSYPITAYAAAEISWTPKIVKERQKKLMKLFEEKWELSKPET